MAPYPKDLERHLTLSDGTAVFARPIRPEDEALYGHFLAAETADDLRLRFFGPVKDRRRVLFALHAYRLRQGHGLHRADETSGEMLGVARLHRTRGDSGEFAVIVRSDIKSHGLG
jgi:hypothetical protein